MALSKADIARRIALDIPPGSYVNLGVGIPTLVAEYLLHDDDIIIHSENGVLGIGGPAPEGEEDPDLIDASKNYVVTRPGAAFFHHADSFAMLRSGRVDIGVLGAYQVSAGGDLANWTRPGGAVPGVGGAMDIAVGVRAVWVAMTHCTDTGEPKIVSACTYPLTAAGVVKRIYTELGVIAVTPTGLELIALAPGVSLDEIEAATGAPLLKGGPAWKN